MKKVVVVGSSTFPIDTPIAVQVVDLLREYEEGTVFLTRGAAGFDSFIMQVAPLMGYRCFAYPGRGGADNFNRDIELVGDGDEVLAFLDPDTLHDPNTGTAHVIEKALDKKKPVRAYTRVGSELIYAGSND